MCSILKQIFIIKKFNFCCLVENPNSNIVINFIFYFVLNNTFTIVNMIFVSKTNLIVTFNYFQSFDRFYKLLIIGKLPVIAVNVTMCF